MANPDMEAYRGQCCGCPMPTPTAFWFPVSLGTNLNATQLTSRMSGNRHPQHGVPLIVLAAALAFASGATDIASFTQLGEVFCSVMTGNLVLLGLATARVSGELAAHTAVAFAGYLAGAALGSRVGGRSHRDDVLWPAPVTATLLVELLAFAGFTVGWELTDSHPTGAGQLGLLAVAALAMGL
jgi:uncharacterized membrane protein YoaK (UPF0700 family)